MAVLAVPRIAASALSCFCSYELWRYVINSFKHTVAIILAWTHIDYWTICRRKHVSSLTNKKVTGVWVGRKKRLLDFVVMQVGLQKITRSSTQIDDVGNRVISPNSFQDTPLVLTSNVGVWFGFLFSRFQLTIFPVRTSRTFTFGIIGISSAILLPMPPKRQLRKPYRAVDSKSQGLTGSGTVDIKRKGQRVVCVRQWLLT